jgi:hypothetical protein
MDKKQTIFLLLLTLLILGVDHHFNFGVTALLSDFLVVFLAIGIILGIVYSRGE